MPWQKELKDAVKSLEQLDYYHKLSQTEKMKLKKIEEKHPMRIPPYYLSLINWDDPDDPIKKMAVPSFEELNVAGMIDTSGEKENTKMPGLQHKYRETALILATNRCAMYCRFCFRKRLVGLPSDEILRRFSEAAKYVKNHPEITNVLVSGGDPFVLPTPIIEKFLKMLSDIPHLDFIRFGTRTLVTLPHRVLEDEGLVDLLARYNNKKRIYISTHFNHPREITDLSSEAVKRLTERGIVISNQTVLLKGVNDNANTMVELMRKLTRIGVIPYYVFQCRPVKRVKHGFQVTIKEGVRIINETRARLDGYSKRFRYAMSHRTGKIEIIDIIGDEVYLKYHQAKNPKNHNKFFKRKLTPNAGWLDDLLPA